MNRSLDYASLCSASLGMTEWPNTTRHPDLSEAEWRDLFFVDFTHDAS